MLPHFEHAIMPISSVAGPSKHCCILCTFDFWIAGFQTVAMLTHKVLPWLASSRHVNINQEEDADEPVM